jgi:hypothetical protein
VRKLKPHIPRISLSSERAVRLVTDAGILTIHWRASRRHEPIASPLIVEDEQWLTEEQIARRTSLSEVELRQMRFSHSGPPHLRDGNAILYRISMIKQWRSMQP